MRNKQDFWFISDKECSAHKNNSTECPCGEYIRNPDLWNCQASRAEEESQIHLAEGEQVMGAIDKFQETERKAEDLIWRLDIFIREAANLGTLEGRRALMDEWTPLKAFVREIIRDNGKLMEKLEILSDELKEPEPPKVEEYSEADVCL